MISVVIPSYKEPDYLDLCLKSCLNGLDNEQEIIVVIDGFYDMHEKVLSKYPTIKVLNLEQNRGLSVVTNLGVSHASNEFILVVNNDNVFPKSWDTNLIPDLKSGRVLTPNQIEPRPSIFSQFIIENLGTDPNKFDLDSFWNREREISVDKLELSGSTLPFAMFKNDFLALGGWDELYPSMHVVDWDFFLRCEYFNFEMVRTYKSNFYHFASVSSRATPEQNKITQEKEFKAQNFYHQKWGIAPYHNSFSNSKIHPSLKL